MDRRLSPRKQRVGGGRGSRCRARRRKSHLRNQGNEAYKTLFNLAKEGLDPLIVTYQKEKTTVTADGIRKWSEHITKVTTEGVEQATNLEGEAQKVKDLWALKDITRINDLIAQMKEKQGNTPISEEVKCHDEIKQLELLLQLKHGRLRKIWDA